MVILLIAIVRLMVTNGRRRRMIAQFDCEKNGPKINKIKCEDKLKASQKPLQPTSQCQNFLLSNMASLGKCETSFCHVHVHVHG